MIATASRIIAATIAVLALVGAAAIAGVSLYFQHRDTTDAHLHQKLVEQQIAPARRRFERAINGRWAR